MALTGLSQLPPSARAALAPGEEPLAWETVALWGEDRIGRTQPPKAIEGLDLNPVSAVASGPVVVDPGLFDRWVGGIALTGHTGSVADSLGHALKVVGQGRLAVTTQRIILFREGDMEHSVDPASGRDVAHLEASEVWSIDRAAVASTQRQSRLFMSGRLVVRFKDASTVALMCGVFSPRGANRLRESLLPAN